MEQKHKILEIIKYNKNGINNNKNRENNFDY